MRADVVVEVDGRGGLVAVEKDGFRTVDAGCVGLSALAGEIQDAKTATQEDILRLAVGRPREASA